VNKTAPNQPRLGRGLGLDPFAHGGESFTPGLHLRIGFDL
jgi:hypothetical protein